MTAAIRLTALTKAVGSARLWVVEVPARRGQGQTSASCLLDTLAARCLRELAVYPGSNLLEQVAATATFRCAGLSIQVGVSEVTDGAAVHRLRGLSGSVSDDAAWLAHHRATVAPTPPCLTDAQWQLIQPLLPPPSSNGRPDKHPRREIVNAIFYVARTGCAWRLLPHDLPPWPEFGTRRVFGTCQAV